MDVTFEYILASIIIFLMLGTSIYTVTSLTSTQLALVTEQQLTPVAQQMMDKILLTRGSPSDWGYNITTNSTNLVDFGIGSSIPGSSLYDVDPAKMLKLVNDSSAVVNNLYIPPTVSGGMLGVYSGGRYTYGFRLYIVPALNVTAGFNTYTLKGSQNYPDNFTVHVQSADGVPAPSAKVNLTMYEFVVSKGGGNNPDSFNYYASKGSATTNYLGNVTFSFGSAPAQLSGSDTATFVVAISADYFGLLSNAIIQYPAASTGFNAILDGQYLVCNMSQVAGFPNAAAHLGSVSILEITNNLGVILNPATNATGSGQADKLLNTGSKDLQIYSLANPVTPDVILAGIMVTRQGKTFFVLATQPILPVCVNYYTNAFANNLQSSLLLNSVTVQRFIHVNRDSYVAYLTVWRTST